MFKPNKIFGMLIALLFVFLLVGCFGDKEPKAEDVIADVKTELESILPSETQQSINLPTSLDDYDVEISWSSDQTTILSNTGQYSSPTNDTTVNLVATVTYKSKDYTLDFEITVKPSNDQVVANTVIAHIDALPDNIALSDKTTVNQVKSEYDALTNAQKTLVTNLDTLNDALDLIARLEVEALISALPDHFTLTVKDDVLAAKSAYDALEQTLQALVTNKTKLETLMTELNALQAITKNDIITEINTTLTENMEVPNDGLTLPATVLSIPVTWTSSDTEILGNDGTLISRPIGNDVTVTLVASFALYDGEETYHLPVLVKTGNIEMFTDLLVENGATMTYNDENTVATIVTSTSDGRIKNTSIPFEANTFYKLIITLKASEEHTTNRFRLGEWLGVDPWYSDYMPADERTMTLTTEYQTYEYVFKTNDDISHVNIELVFNKGGLTIEVTEFVFEVIHITDEVKDLEDAIEALPSPITLDDEDDVIAVREMIENSQQILQDNISNIAKLELAEEFIIELKQQVIVDNVIDLISQITDDLTQENYQSVLDARAAYDALDETLKADVTNYNVLVSKEDYFAQNADTEAPVFDTITHVDLAVGTDYDLLNGVTATDNLGDVTGNITITDDDGFNKDVAGTYFIKYSVADAFGNTTTAYKIITVSKIDEIDLFTKLRVESGATLDWNLDDKVAMINCGSTPEGRIKIYDIPFEDNTAYRLTLTLKASEAHTTNRFRLGYPLSASPWYNDYLIEDERILPMTTDFTTNEYILVTGNDAANSDIIIVFNKVNLEVQISDISFEKVNLNDLARPFKDKVSDINAVYNDLDIETIEEARTLYDALSYHVQQNASAEFGELVYHETNVNSIREVIEKINMITTDLTIENKDNIVEAKTLYDALSVDLKAAVTNVNILNNALTLLDTINQATTPVVNAIDSIGIVDTSPECLQKIEQARNLYDALDDAYKVFVSNYNVLVAAEDEYITQVGPTKEQIDAKILTLLPDNMEVRKPGLSLPDAIYGIQVVLVSGNQEVLSNEGRVLLNQINEDLTVEFQVSYSLLGTEYTNDYSLIVKANLSETTLIQDPYFDQDTIKSPWAFISGFDVNTMDIANGILSLNVENPGEWASKVKLYGSFYDNPFEYGGTYMLEFYAKADQARKMQIRFGVIDWNWSLHDFGGQKHTINLTEQMTKYQIIVPIDVEHINFHAIEFNIGQFAYDGGNYANNSIQVDSFRILKYDGDVTSPKIENAENTDISVGTSFNLLDGVSATDNVDGDLTDQIQIIDDDGFDTSIAGNYYIHYRVTDSSYNITDYYRLVTVTEVDVVNYLTKLVVYNNDSAVSIKDGYVQIDAGAGIESKIKIDNIPLKNNTAYHLYITIKADSAFETNKVYFASNGSNWTLTGTTESISTDYQTLDILLNTGDNGALSGLSFKFNQSIALKIQITSFEFVEVE